MVFSGRLVLVSVPPSVTAGVPFNVSTKWQNTSGASGTCGVSVLVDGNVATTKTIALGGLSPTIEVSLPVTVGPGTHLIRVQTSCSVLADKTSFITIAAGTTEIIQLDPIDVVGEVLQANALQVWNLLGAGAGDTQIDTFIRLHSFGGVTGESLLAVKQDSLYNVGRLDQANNVAFQGSSFQEAFQRTLDTAFQTTSTPTLEFTAPILQPGIPPEPSSPPTGGGVGVGGIGLLLLLAAAAFALKKR